MCASPHPPQRGVGNGSWHIAMLASPSSFRHAFVGGTWVSVLRCVETVYSLPCAVVGQMMVLYH